MQRLFSKRALGTALLVSGLILGGCQSSPDGTKAVKIRSAHSNWVEEKFQTEILNIGLEQLGYQIEAPKEVDYPAIYVSLANGDLDYSPVNYDISHTGFFENAGGSQTLEQAGVLIANPTEGYQVDKKTADQYKISSLEQLKDPKLAKLFDSDGDGKANLVGCNPGWFCEQIIDHHIQVYGLEDTVENDRGQYTTLLGEVITRYQQGGSVLYYAYDPHWISTVLKPSVDVTWLSVPFTDLPGKLKAMTAAETSVDGKNFGFPKNKQRVVANKDFLAANPMAKRWFEQVTIPIADMNAESLRIKEGEDSPEDIRRHAEDWVKNNQALVDGWIAEAKKAAQ